MRNIIRFYHQNRKSIWIFLLVIFFLFLMLQVINYFVGVNQKNKIINQNIIKNQINHNQSNLIVDSDKSLVSGEKINTNYLQITQESIEKFLNNCNQGKVDEAYQMLTDECKEEMYPSIEIFEETYSSKLFNGQDINCNIENWVGDTYKVQIQGDSLATGKVSQNKLQDYITIKKDMDNVKLNINSYIGRTKLEKSNSQKDIVVTILQKDTYMDYEKYNIRIENHSNSDILLDTKQKTDSMYIEDRKKSHYSAYTHELSDADLLVYGNYEKNITIKYYSSYNSGKSIQRLVFSNVVMNYDSTERIANGAHIEEIGVNI